MGTRAQRKDGRYRSRRRDEDDAADYAKAIRNHAAAEGDSVSRILDVVERVSAEFLRVAFMQGRHREFERIRGAGRLLPLPGNSRIVRRAR